MNTNPMNKGIIEQNSNGVGEISGEMVEERAEELAIIAGRSVTSVDGDQALRELTGGDRMNAEQATLESAFEDKRWDPIHGSTGNEVEASFLENEGEDGQTQSAQLCEEGVNEAAHDQMLQAALAGGEMRPKVS